MKTNEDIFKEIVANKEITKKQIDLLKNRSNRLQKDQISYIFHYLEIELDSYGLPVKKEDGEKLLKWLKLAKFKKLYGYRELAILETAKPEDIFLLDFIRQAIFTIFIGPIFMWAEWYSQFCRNRIL